MFIERKTWHDSWVQNQSIKERFDLPYGYTLFRQSFVQFPNSFFGVFVPFVFLLTLIRSVCDFLSGELTPLEIVEKMRKKKGLDNKTAGEVLVNRL